MTDLVQQTRDAAEAEVKFERLPVTDKIKWCLDNPDALHTLDPHVGVMTDGRLIVALTNAYVALKEQE